MSCYIYNKSFLSDVTDVNKATINLSWLKSLIPSYSTVTGYSGIWQPIFISGTSLASSGLPLMLPKTHPVSKFAPCSCIDAQIDPEQIDSSANEINLCKYCGNYEVAWKLYDSNGNQSTLSHTGNCCSGACDTMLKSDDYLQKIPVLNQSYLTGIYDYKHQKQFPACTNPGIGKESFISISDTNRIKIKGADLKIDWVLQPTISEVLYDSTTSNHDSEYLHKKSYDKSKMVSKTCGNFILLSIPSQAGSSWYQQNYTRLSGLIGSTITNDTQTGIVPKPDQFYDLPHGIDQETYKNIFVKDEKIASYWKWNITSGILCWYRYYDKDMINDPRPIPGIDLYISPGDVFFATNDGPEPSGDQVNPTGLAGIIQKCPSGLKILKGAELDCIIPSGSQFAYISANIYDKFYTVYKQLSASVSGTGYIKAFKDAAILATSPLYDKVTMDLLKNNPIQTYPLNSYGQVDLFNRDMQKGTNFDSVSRLGYASNTGELITILSSKYGEYLWAPPNSTTTIKFDKTINASFAVDIDFDMVLKTSDTYWSTNTCTPINSCSSRSLNKTFSYTQHIGYPNSILKVVADDGLRYTSTCSGTTTTDKNFNIHAGLYLNSSRIKSIPLSSGCCSFEDKYPRISQQSTTSFCNDCDQSSSYYLIDDVEDIECGSKNGSNSFCYETLARRFNNSPAQFEGDLKNRVERSISDGTLKFKRSYKGLFFNPHVDLVAFHEEGGVFFNSKPFGLEAFTAFEKSSSISSISTTNIEIKFITNDVGIKIYKLFAEYLQTNKASSYGCKRFPVSNSCQCLPMTISNDHQYLCNTTISSISSSNIYSPALSTKYSAKLSKYGGYNQSYLDSIFGTSTLTAGGTLTALSRKINPEYPYGCYSAATISLYNYTNTDWTLNLTNFTTNHSDIVIKASENANIMSTRLTMPTVTIPYANTIKDYKRYTTKIKINDSLSFYSFQERTLSSLGTTAPTTLNVKLQNPFLEKLMTTAGAQPNTILYPPSGNLLADHIFLGMPNGGTGVAGLSVYGGGFSIDSHRGNEVSAVTLTIKRKPRKQILNFSIPAPTSMGTLTKGFFHPNSGLTSSTTNKSPIKDKKLYYDAPIESSSDSDVLSEFDTGFCLYGKLTPRVINTIRSLNEFNSNKQLRLYLKISNKWYMYKNIKIGGYVANNKTYIGQPVLFEYLNNVLDSKNLPGVMPVTAKKHTNFNFIYNSYNYQKVIKPEFPLAYNRISIDDSRKKITIPGTRHYFMVPEVDPAKSVNLNSIYDISNLETEEPTVYENMKFGTILLFKDGSYWACIDTSNKSSIKGYTYSEFNYLYHNFSDLHINFLDTSKNGYVYNTEKLCDYKFLIYNKKSNTWDTVNKIIKKRIKVKFVTSNGRPTTNLSGKDVYMVPYTEFDTNLKVSEDYNIVDLMYSPNYTNGAEDANLHAFTISFITAPLSESDRLLINDYMPGKWGDVVNYDGTILDAYTAAFVQPEDFYPSTTYNNDFYKIIVNNHNQLKHKYKIFYKDKTSDKSFKFNHDNLVYYNILQKYNIGTEDPYPFTTALYHNYLPILDLNITTSGTAVDAQDASFASWIKQNNKDNQVSSGIINISSLLRNINFNTEKGSDFTAPATGTNDPYFWVNFSSGNLEPVSAFVPTSGIFYSDSLKINDPPYWLTATTLTEISKTTNTRYSCRTTFKPNGLASYAISSSSNNSNSSSYKTKTYLKDKPFFTYNHYCDTDDNSCDNLGCFNDPQNHPGMMINGQTTLAATYNIGQNTSTTLSSSSTDFFISYDAGVYNTVGNDSYVSIKRFELPPDNQIELYSEKCSAGNVFPSNYQAHALNPIYQSTLNSATAVTHEPIVNDTDNMANEILFRILYGEGQAVNKDMLYVKNKRLTKKDLIDYSSKKITPIDIYDDILYNYDRTSTISPINSKITGSFTVYGKPSVGSKIDITIGSTVVNFTIQRVNGRIVLSGTIAGELIEFPLFIEYREIVSYFVQMWKPTDPTPGPLQPMSDGMTVTKISDCNLLGRQHFRLINGNGPINPTDAVSLTCSMSFANAQEIYSVGTNGLCCCGTGPCGGACPVSSVTQFDPVGMQKLCGQETYGKVDVVPGRVESITYPCGPNKPYHGTGGACSVYEIGYCRKNNCETCDTTFESRDSKNFDYNFEYCRTNFNLFGHAYREKHIVLPSDRVVPATEYCYLGSNPGQYTCEPTPVTRSLQEEMDQVKANAFTGYQILLDANNQEYCAERRGGIGDCGAGDKLCLWLTCDGGSPPGCLGTDIGSGENLKQDECSFCSAGSLFRSVGRDWPFGENFCDTYTQCCGVSAYGSRTVDTYRRIWKLTETQNTGTYVSDCVSPVITVNYTEKSITFNVNGNSKCISNTLSICPTTQISSSMMSFHITDSLDTSCDSCGSPAQVSLPAQKQNFTTITETRKCVLGVRYVSSSNPKGLVTYIQQTRLFTEGTTEFDAPTSTVGFRSQCGGGAIQYDCWEFGAVLETWEDKFMPMMIECAKGMNSEMAASVAAYEMPEWEWEVSQNLLARGGYLGGGSNHIPVADIIEGIVPGSVKTPVLATFNVGGQSITRGGGGTSNVLTAYVLYYEYKYIRPVNLQDILRNDDSLLCSSDNKVITDEAEQAANMGVLNPISISCSKLPFPPIYMTNFSNPVFQDTVGLINAQRFYDNKGNIGGSSYTKVLPQYEQNSHCFSAVSCYYNHNVYICPQNDPTTGCCLADLLVVRNIGVEPMSNGKYPCTSDETYVDQPDDDVTTIIWQ
jgi:hypothetical protein